MNSDATDLLSGYRGIRVLVPGASGFIGRRVVQAFVKAGAVVYAVVRSRTAVVPNEPSVTKLCCDLRDEAGLRRIFADVRPSVIFNLAGYGVDPAERDEAIAYAVNAVAPATLCKLASEYSDGTWHGQRLVHAGSALEYGHAGGDLVEACTPRPTTLYGRSKLDGSLAVAAAAVCANLRACTARLFTVYGPGERPHRLLPSLLRAAGTGETLDLSDGVQRRDFTWVDDVVDGLLRLGMSNAEPGEVVNVATGKLTSVREFVLAAAEVLGIAEEQLRFGVLPTRSEEMWHDPVSVVRLHQLTSWIPHTTPTEGILCAAAAERTQAAMLF